MHARPVCGASELLGKETPFRTFHTLDEASGTGVVQQPFSGDISTAYYNGWYVTGRIH
jgi:hypothetical protein